MIEAIIKQLKNNQIGILEHDTVPGIVARMSSENAKTINNLKKRDPNKGFIILIPSLEYLKKLTKNIPDSTLSLIKTYWPGALTIILEKNDSICSSITGNELTIAIRYPKHTLLNKILSSLNEPLISTSANISGETVISKQLLDNINFTYGDLTINQNKAASTIIDGTARPFKILRQGIIKIPV